jgi:hypothetical protein
MGTRRSVALLPPHVTILCMFGAIGRSVALGHRQWAPEVSGSGRRQAVSPVLTRRLLVAPLGEVIESSLIRRAHPDRDRADTLFEKISGAVPPGVEFHATVALQRSSDAGGRFIEQLAVNVEDASLACR